MKEEKVKEEKLKLPDYVKYTFRSIFMIVVCAVVLVLLIMLAAKTLLPHSNSNYGSVYEKILK